MARLGCASLRDAQRPDDPGDVMTSRPFYQSDRDSTYWRPPLPVVNPESLPLVWHALAWAPFGREPALVCQACDFATRDLGAAAEHLAATQWTAGYRPAPVAIDPPRGNADERGDEG
jgi:hypothetical protein